MVTLYKRIERWFRVKGYGLTQERKGETELKDW